MSALPRGEVFSEQMWVVFFALSVKDPTLSKITEDTWLSLYGRKDSTKFDKFLKENGIEWCVKNMPLDSRFNRAGLKAAQERFPASGLNWHNALKAQVVSLENIKRER